MRRTRDVSRISSNGSIRWAHHPHPSAPTSKGTISTYTWSLPRRTVGSMPYQGLCRRHNLKPQVRLLVCKPDRTNLMKRVFTGPLSILSSRMTRYVIFGLFTLTMLNCSELQSLNVIECPEFRQLILLLRSNLNDSQVPRRTKIRELVLQAWSQYFQALRRSLAVCLPISFDNRS